MKGRFVPMSVHLNDNSAWRAFEESELTHSAAHYLMTIMHLRKQNGYARVTDISRELKVTKSAASRAIGSMKERGLIDEDSNRMLRLTEKGRNLARIVERNYMILERFLGDVLEVQSEIAREDACKMEHLLSNESTAAIFQLIRILNKDEKLMKALKSALRNPEPACTDDELCDLCEDFESCIADTDCKISSC
jgi:Mn-dependent DtxR family transcriptional regulator